ncbi:hypothetical protein OR60_21550 [Xanthomonas vesicatoria]|uniref:Uncharacterized protein n=1 Tax=Xanthomonas vesicatoria TaxID=56460 RepID=A0AAJ0N2Y6_9XANT|nr:hypothetical protein OR60_21550 [Xanthomonas vesicatoria]KHM92253.1 hypothetical protein OR61_17105 [Xanthomonas vesicatoria]
MGAWSSVTINAVPGETNAVADKQMLWPVDTICMKENIALIRGDKAKFLMIKYMSNSPMLTMS